MSFGSQDSYLFNLDTTTLIDLHNKVVEEITNRYFILRDKERLGNSLTDLEKDNLDNLLNCVKKENRRKVEPGSLEDRINRFLDENLPK